MTAVPDPGAWQHRGWFIACRAAELSRPRGVVMQGRPLVLFRDGAGVARALRDRCPHRGVPLSGGKVVEGALQCPYHGWRFDGGGECVAVPGLEGPAELKARCVEAYATRESQGYVWVYASPNVEPAEAPYRFPASGEPGYTTVRRRFEVEAPLFPVLENTLDVPHTGFLHGGLFRTSTKKNAVKVTVRREGGMAEARFEGEPVPKGLLGRLVAPQGGVVEHVDRFELPSVALVDYRLGKWHVVSTSVMTPVDPRKTVVWAEVSFRLPLPGWLVAPFVAPVATRIFAQDAVLLRAQQRAAEAWPDGRYVSTELDVLGPQIARLLKAAQAGEELPPPHTHEARMVT